LTGRRRLQQLCRTLRRRAGELKAEARADGDEDAAARLLMGECFVQGLGDRTRLWIAVREGRMNEAWAALVHAQVAFEASIRAHPAGEQFQGLLSEVEALEGIVFPPQTFVSAGMLIRESRCSICERPFGTCEHIQGRVYGGEFAGRIVSEAEPYEISFVDIPDDKMCRAFRAEDSEGVMRCTLTGDPIDEPEQDKPTS
jgi:hypothetical protein